MVEKLSGTVAELVLLVVAEFQEKLREKYLLVKLLRTFVSILLGCGGRLSQRLGCGRGLGVAWHCLRNS